MVIFPDKNGVVDLKRFFIVIVLDKVKNVTALFEFILIPFKNDDVTGCYNSSPEFILDG